MDPLKLLFHGLRAASLGYRTFKDNQIIDDEIMMAAKSEDPHAALDALIEEYDNELQSELERSRELRKQA